MFDPYQLYSFYVEMLYDLRKNKRLIRIRSHMGPYSIQKYLMKIDIPQFDGDFR